METTTIRADLQSIIDQKDALLDEIASARAKLEGVKETAAGLLGTLEMNNDGSNLIDDSIRCVEDALQWLDEATDACKEARCEIQEVA